MLKSRIAAVLALMLALGLSACGGGDDGPTDPAGILNSQPRPVGTVFGTVTSSVDASPISNAEVLVVSTPPAGVGGITAEGGTLGFRVLTNVDGTYRALNTPIGQLQVVARAPGFRTSAPQFWSLATNGQAPLNFVLSPGSGTTPGGEPLDIGQGDDQSAFPFNYNGSFFSDRGGGGGG